MIQRSLIISAITVAGIFVGISSVMAADDNNTAYPQINYGTGAKAEQLKRGEYLVKMGDCIACHTEKNGQPFAGGLAFNTPFGILYSPNITGDKETGIGNWSEAQFFKAVREGISPKKEYYYPAFPFIYYNKITDQDLRDIKAYLDAIPAVSKGTLPKSYDVSIQLAIFAIRMAYTFFQFQENGSLSIWIRPRLLRGIEVRT